MSEAETAAVADSVGEASGSDDQRRDDAEQDTPEAWQAATDLSAILSILRPRPELPTIGGDGVGGNKFVVEGGLTVHAATGSRSRAVGEVPAEELERVFRVFAASRGYDTAYDELRSRRVVVLRGSQASGRRSAALRLLCQVADNTVLSLDPETEPDRIVDHLRPGRAHHLASPVTSGDAPLRRVHLHAARRQLESTGGYLVITVEPDTVLDDVEEIIEWIAPEPTDVVRAHLDGRGGLTPDEVRRLVELPETATFLAGRPSPAEAARFSQLLAGHADGRVGVEQLAEYGAAAASELIEDWFQGSGPELREQAFLLALAVLDRAPYPSVAEAADQLFERLHAVQQPDESAVLSIFSATRASRLTLARAHEYDEVAGGRWGISPQRLFAFRNPVTSALVLKRVWMDYPAAREPLRDWLINLGMTSRESVRLRVAVAAGTLACEDFGDVVARLVVRWAESDLARQRQLAVWALCAAAEQGCEVAVRRVASEWSRGAENKQWVAARVYGAIGSRAAGVALRRLGEMAESRTGWSHDLNLAQSVATLLGGDAALVVLSELSDVGRGKGRRAEVARQGFLRAALRRDPSGRYTLLFLAMSDSTAWAQHAQLWRLTLNDPASREDARQRLRSWVQAADLDPDSERGLRRLIIDLADSDTAFDRLDYLLRKVRDRDSSRTLPVAERLRAGLHDSKTTQSTR